MVEKPTRDFEEWFYKASEDELSIQAILKEGGAPSTACFLSEQMAEKYLKGLLVFRGKPFPKIHDLLTLATLLLKEDPDIKDIQSALVQLNRYYIETRYPGDYPPFSTEEAKEALKAANEVKELVRKKVYAP